MISQAQEKPVPVTVILNHTAAEIILMTYNT